MVVGFFVCGMMGRFDYEKYNIIFNHYSEYFFSNRL